MRVLFVFTKIVAFISLLLFPIRLNKVLCSLKNAFLSYRVSLFSSCHNRISLQAPFYIAGGKHIKFGSNFGAKAGFRIECIEEYAGIKYNPQVIIGNNVRFNFYCHVGAINEIIIGDDVLIGSHVLITDHSHGNLSFEEMDKSPIQRMLHSKGPVIIEHNVWIGEGVAILPNVTIGHHSIIGANSVVTKNIPPYSIAGGSPAQVFKNIK